MVEQVTTENEEKHPPLDEAAVRAMIQLKELKYVRKLLNLHMEAQVFKEQLTTNWDSYIKFVRGQQWPRRRPKYKVSAVLNFMLENVERKTALLTDAKPIPNVTPRNDKDQNTANILNAL